MRHHVAPSQLLLITATSSIRESDYRTVYMRLRSTGINEDDLCLTTPVALVHDVIHRT